MTIYHIEFAKTGMGISGGEVWMLEVIKHLKSKGLHNVLLTTDNGKKAYEKAGLKEDKMFEFKIIRSYDYEKSHPIFVSYIHRTLQAVRLVKNLALSKDDAVFCHSDFFPNSIPTSILRRRNPDSKYYYLFHMLAPSIFKGYEGQFTGRFQMPRFNIVHYKLNQWLYNKLMPKKATIITSNNYYQHILRQKCPETAIYVMDSFAGADETQQLQSKQYDLIWMGRFHPQKGLLELPAVIEAIKRKLPDVKAVVVGDGDPAIKQKILQEIKLRGLENNIELKGFVMGDEKYRYLNQSKLFLMTSFYESFGIVNVEALKNGVPVIAYDMPVYSPFAEGMVKLRMRDKQAMANKAIELLTQSATYRAISQKAHDFGKNFSWQRTGEEIYQLL